MLHDDLIRLLSIKGFAKPDAVAEVLSIDGTEVDRALSGLAELGQAEESKLGWRLTASGKACALELSARERAATDARAMDHVYERFCDLNDRFKSTIVRWQVRRAGGADVPNDHTDAAYDASVLDDIQVVHDAIVALLDDLIPAMARARTYRERFERALEKARRGERRFVAAPLIDSYHTVWFELHEDLIRLSGRNRKDEAAAGRGA